MKGKGMRGLNMANSLDNTRPIEDALRARAEKAEAKVSRLLGVVKPIVNYARVEIYECGGHGWMLEKPLKEFDKVVKEWERKDD